MKRKDLLLLTLLLTQTAPLWAMQLSDRDNSSQGIYPQRTKRERQGRSESQEEHDRKRQKLSSHSERMSTDEEDSQEGQGLHHGEPQEQETYDNTAWSNEDKKAMKAAGGGQEPFAIQRSGFKYFLSHKINELVPSFESPKVPISSNLGKVQQHVLCTFTGGKKKDLTLPTFYPLEGKWFFKEDREHTQEIATLKLRVSINGQKRWIDKQPLIELEIKHDLLDPSVLEYSGRNYFDGAQQVYLAHIKQQSWRNPRTGQEYSRNLVTQEDELPRHKDHQVIYVEHFPFESPPDHYKGSYLYKRNLNARERLLPDKKVENLIYSDGSHIYLPNISQELWKKDNTKVRFFIASYKQDRQLNFLPDNVYIENGSLPEGLYQLMSVQDELGQRIEKWKRLGEDQNLVDVIAPQQCSSIPGVGKFAPHIVLGESAVKLPIQGMDPSAEQLLARAKSLNDYLVNYMKSEFSQRVFNSFMERIDEHKGNGENLRYSFINVSELLNAIPTDSLENFLQKLASINVNMKKIKQTTDKLASLKIRNTDIVYEITNWREALLNNTIGKIQKLIAPPEEKTQENALTVKGIIIGMDDINKALERNLQTKQLNVFALNTLFLAGELEKKGVSVNFIAPQWKVTSKVTINLRGLDGLPGSNGTYPGDDGASGGPGGKGGNFFGLTNAIIQPQNLTINTSGGRGGPGGNGVKGSNGTNGASGDLNAGSLPNNSKQYGKTYHREVKKDKGHPYISCDITAYEIPGSDGTPGQDGGKGGKGGLGGNPGFISLKVPDSERPKIVINSGTQGDNGQSAEGGVGGLHGKNTYWVHETNPHRIFSPPEMSSSNRNPRRAASGKQPDTFNADGQENPTPQIAFNDAPLIAEYKNYYETQAAKPDFSPFIKVFPNLQ